MAGRHGPDLLKTDFPQSPGFRRLPALESMEGTFVFESKKSTALTKYFQTKLAVVEVGEGESQEEAWQRYLTLHPEYSDTHIKVFHYPAKDPPDKKKGRLANPPLLSTGEDTSWRRI